jgi:hypothetical protein
MVKYRFNFKALLGCGRKRPAEECRPTLHFRDIAFFASVRGLKGDARYALADGVLFNENKTSIHACSQMKQGTFVVPDSVTRIEDFAFEGCRDLTSIILPNSITYIGDDAFVFCGGLTSMLIPEGVTHLGFASFYGCNGLTTVSIPSSVTGTGDNVFYGSPRLTDVRVKWNTPLNVSSSIFTNVNLAAATLTVPAGTKSLYQAADVWKMFGTIQST